MITPKPGWVTVVFTYAHNDTSAPTALDMVAKVHRVTDVSVTFFLTGEVDVVVDAKGILLTLKGEVDRRANFAAPVRLSDEQAEEFVAAASLHVNLPTVL